MLSYFIAMPREGRVGPGLPPNSVQSKREPVDLIGVRVIERSTLAFAGRAVTLEIAQMGSRNNALSQLHDADLLTPTHSSPRNDISLPPTTCPGRRNNQNCL